MNKQRVCRNAAKFYAARIEKGMTIVKGTDRVETTESRRIAIQHSISDAIQLEQLVEEGIAKVEAYRSESFG